MSATIEGVFVKATGKDAGAKPAEKPASGATIPFAATERLLNRPPGRRWAFRCSKR